MKHFFLLSALFFLVPSGIFAQSESDSSLLSRGFEAYRKGDVKAARALLNSAVALPEYDTDAARYVLILADIDAGSFKSAAANCAAFITKFKDSPYSALVQYQCGRVLHALGRNNEAAAELLDFCAYNKGHPLYAGALFLLGECAFEEGRHSAALDYFRRLLSERPDDPNAPMAHLRMEEIGRILGIQSEPAPAPKEEPKPDDSVSKAERDALLARIKELSGLLDAERGRNERLEKQYAQLLGLLSELTGTMLDSEEARSYAPGDSSEEFAELLRKAQMLREYVDARKTGGRK